MNYLLFFTVFFSLIGFYFLLALYVSRKIKTTTDYFLAGRNLGFFYVTLTLVATQIGGGMLLGTSQEAYNVGLYGIMYTIGMSFGFLLLGLGFASKLQSLNVSTTAALFETKYNSPFLKKIASLLSIATMFGILVGQVVASRALLEGIGVTNELIFLGFWAFIITYTILGGLKAVAITDSAQVIFVILVFGGIFLYALSGEPTSFFSFASLANIQSMFPPETITLTKLTGIALMPALFSLIEQDLAQRFFASRTKKIAAFSAITASAFLLMFSLVPIYFGMKAKMLGMTFSGSPLLPYLAQITNEFVLILAICGIIAAIMSTGDSLLCAVSSNLSLDFDFSFTGITNKLRLSKIITFIIGIGAIAASYLVSKNIISILVGSYEISVSCLLVPLLVSYFRSNLNKNAAIGSIIFGLTGFILFRLYPIAFPKEIVSIGLSILGYVLFNFLAPKKRLVPVEN
ncbi:sodium:solute symporter [Candidatus Dependentiae bacterium]